MTKYEYRDEEVLKRLYVEKRLSLREISDELGCSESTIHRWMNRHEIERRSESEGMKIAHRKTPANYRMNGKGYMHVESAIGENRWTTPVHRLIAVSENGIKPVKENEVHHKNGIRWDNRPDNLELMDSKAHSEHHNPGALSWVEKITAAEMNNVTYQYIIAEHFGVSRSTVSRAVQEVNA